MAGDWIKLEHTTPDKPEVVRIAAFLDIDQDAVVGKLARIWIWADQNSLDGKALTVSDTFLDRVTARPGFAAALREVGWLSGRQGLLTIPNFDRHNGQTAKSRANTNRRVSRHRDKAHPESGGNAPSVTPALPKPLPEKIREEKEEGVEERAREWLLEGEVQSPANPVWGPATGWAGVSPEHKQRWKLGYPACDIERQLVQMDIWLRANPAEASKSNWLRFISNWLKREQDKGGDSRADRKTNHNHNAPHKRPNDRSTGFTAGYSEQLNAAGL